MRYTARASYYHRMNTISIFLYVISVVAWWAGFNYAATHTESPTRRKLLSTAAAFALAWPFAFIALAAALATKLAANIMIAVGDHINNTWDAAVSDENGTTIVTKLTPMGTAIRVRRENSDTSAANSSDDGDGNNAASSEETHPALADNMPLMPPPPPPATDEARGYTVSHQSDVNNNAAAETADSDDSADNNINNDETITIQKVTLAEII